MSEVNKNIKVSGKQVAAARVLLGMTQDQLAAAAGLSRHTVMQFEMGKKQPHQSTTDALREALERRGIEFSNGDRPGVRFDPAKAIIPT